jgi:NTE family protein
MPIPAQAQSKVASETPVTIIKPDFSDAAPRYPNLSSFHPIQRPKVAIVLSGGGARGIAAIGVLRVLERNRMPADLIVGTSMGSIIGGLYAMGYSSDQLQRMVDTTDWDELLSFTDDARRRDLFLDQKLARDRSVLVLRFDGFSPVIPKAFSTGQRLSKYLNILSLQGIYQPDPSFDDLRIPFRAVTTDLVTGKRIVIDSGDMTEALRASMAIPLLFSSVPRDSMQLLDGGVVGNLPVDVALEQHAEIVVAVDMVSPLRPKSSLNAPWEIADQITTIMMQEVNKLARAKADLVIVPNIGSHMSSDFTNLDSLIASGESAAEAALPLLRKLIEEHTLQRYHKVDTVRYENPRFFWKGDTTSVFDDCLRAFERRGRVNKTDLQILINEAYDKGDYAAVEGSVEQHRDSTCISINVKQNPILKEAIISGNQVFPSDSLISVFRPLFGRPLNVKRTVSAIERLLSIYRTSGYSFARIIDVRFDSVSSKLCISIDEGVIYRTDVRGTEKTRGWVLRREVPWQDNDLFTISKASQGISNLYGTSLFEQIRISVKHEGDSSKLNIPVINVQERNTELIRFGLRIDNERNIQPSIDIRNENLFGTGAEIGLYIGGGTRNQSYISEIKATRIFNSYLTFNLKGYSLIRDINTYADVSLTSSNNIDRERVGEYREIRNGILASFGAQLERLGSVAVEGRLEKHRISNVFSDPITSEEYNLSSIRFGTTVDTQDKLPYPTDGIVINFSYESAIVKQTSSVGFTKMFFSYETYQTIVKNHTIHPRFMLGVADKTLPIIEQFSLGGQQNFFGYREDNARGRQLLVASLEYQYKLPFSLFFDTYFKFRYDFGALWASVEEMRMEDFRHGIGVTFGLDTPIGPAEFSLGRSFYLRKDLLKHPFTFGPFVAYFSIGFPISGVIRN